MTIVLDREDDRYRNPPHPHLVAPVVVSTLFDRYSFEKLYPEIRVDNRPEPPFIENIGQVGMPPFMLDIKHEQWVAAWVYKNFTFQVLKQYLHEDWDTGRVYQHLGNPHGGWSGPEVVAFRLFTLVDKGPRKRIPVDHFFLTDKFIVDMLPIEDELKREITPPGLAKKVQVEYVEGQTFLKSIQWD